MPLVPPAATAPSPYTAPCNIIPLPLVSSAARAATAVSFQKDLLASVGQAIICTDLAGIVTYW